MVTEFKKYRKHKIKKKTVKPIPDSETFLLRAISLVFVCWLLS